MASRKKMVAGIQGSYIYNPITRRTKINRNTVPQASIQNIRSLDIIGYILKKHTRRLHQITSSWADKVRSVHTKKQDTWYYFQSTVKNRSDY